MLALGCALICLAAAGDEGMQEPPKPFGAIPTLRQLAWQETEFYGLIHFGPNTFTGNEWGHGDERPDIFNPTKLDCRQWARAAKAAGMKGLILVAKHHDGFCLWPSQYSTHTVREAAWRGGQGDVVRECAEACREYGLKFGVYLSPWDRNHPDYGTGEAYNEIYRKTAQELMTQYGDLFMFWMDGANGEGPNGKKQVYDFPSFWANVRKHQPMACMFSDVGPDVRWVGNEGGIAGETNWSTLDVGDLLPGNSQAPHTNPSGTEGGERWIPAEADTPLRPGWFWRESENDKVKPLSWMIETYFSSVGRNAAFNLGIAPDDRGLMHENDVARMEEFGRWLKEAFDENLALRVSVGATSSRAGLKQYGAANLTDGEPTTYWATDDDVLRADVVFTLPDKPINCIELSEFIALGQRVKVFEIEHRRDGGQWEPVIRGTTIGYKRLLRIPPYTGGQFRLRILDSLAAPVLSSVGFYNVPVVFPEPMIRRERDGSFVLGGLYGAHTHYTTDGSRPTARSPRFTESFRLPKGGTIRAVAIPMEGIKSFESEPTEASATFGMETTNWRVHSVSAEHHDLRASRAYDGNPNTFWHTPWQGDSVPEHPHWMVIDLGSEQEVTGFTYLPRQDASGDGTIDRYEFAVSIDGEAWSEPAARGTFANILNSRRQQIVRLGTPVRGRYVRLTALSCAAGKKWASAAEIGVLVR